MQTHVHGIGCRGVIAGAEMVAAVGARAQTQTQTQAVATPPSDIINPPRQ
ncbi:MAG TPA: hypothetical protein VH023_00695 [Rhodopila sp.]|jgi:hypothetical protein|nr:hypothetical protein [Rhodopila sp.]